MTENLASRRNIGISAHIDSGKTTLTERILFYTNRIHAIHDVRGKDGVGAKMDSMELERERGITIQSAATHCEWADHHINIIDTPGHVDFTVEVERALRVLDGAVLVLCGVAGVQSQSLTVDRQMRRYNVPRLAFVNKCDRSGANPAKVTEQLREKLALNAVMLQLPIGLEAGHEGVVDLVEMKAIYFDGENGEDLRIEEIPAEMQAAAEAAREELVDAVSMFSEELMEAALEENIPTELLKTAIREATISLQLCPVLCGSAYKNKGVQPLLDAVLSYLPNPTDVTNEMLPLSNAGDEGEAEVLPCDPEGSLVMLAFKLEDGRYGQLTYLRIYHGTLKRDGFITNVRTGKRLKVGRVVRMHSDEMEDIQEAAAGDIVAIFGVDCRSGDTFTDGTISCVMSSMHVPDPVISVSVTPVDSKAQVNMSKALGRFTKEDPTFRVSLDPESNETIVAGMGELHLDVYIERMRREYSAEVTTSPPRVAYREAITQEAAFNYTHKKQTGGSGQYGKVMGRLIPCADADYEFEDSVKGGNIPREFISAVDKGFKSMLAKGPLLGFPVRGVRVELMDGGHHAVDSSDVAFQEAARGAFRASYPQAAPVILEPVMKVEVEGPAEFLGAMVATVTQRRGQISGSQEEDGFARVEADVPLAEMFGYATTLRSATQGKASFTMEFGRYAQVPKQVSEAIIADHEAAKEKAGKNKR
ncbi:MAG: elongation factor G [Rickettsiales bacterium]|nr:elongation factor G [Rickettsiales bacterium]|tara:strand:+ start:636 stop:2741 length:2106 start_codon:yes stop_codon:yes gene_type:complete